jgi:hypothetical protein
LNVLGGKPPLSWCFFGGKVLNRSASFFERAAKDGRHVIFTVDQ